jgi:hypothetical protein
MKRLGDHPVIGDLEHLEEHRVVVGGDPDAVQKPGVGHRGLHRLRRPAAEDALQQLALDLEDLALESFRFHFLRPLGFET